MPMYDLIEYSDNYPKKLESLWQKYKDKPKDNIALSKSFKCKTNISKETPVFGNTKDVKIAVALKYISNFWRTLEMSLMDIRINLIST